MLGLFTNVVSSTELKHKDLTSLEDIGWEKVVRIGQQIRNVDKLMECLTYTATTKFESGKSSKVTV